MTFSPVLGQTKALTLLERALHSERLAHAYLFAGPDGVGKTTTALAMAGVLLCRDPKESRACGHCPGCRKLASDNHPDLLHIRPDGTAIKIDQIRELKKAVAFPPFEARWRVVLLEDIHTMRREAANSLLKLLEEPPAGNILLLVGNALGSLPETIVSRCQVIPFVPLPLALATEVILRHRPECGTADAQALAALTDGCPGQALALEADGVLALYRRVVHALDHLPKTRAERVETALALAIELAAPSQDMELFLSLLRILLKDTLAAHALGSGYAVLPEAKRAKERWNFQQVSAKLLSLDLAEHALSRNCNRGLTSEVLLLDLFDCSASHPPLP
ncbi:MAG: DNA polymerase III subunit delta' [Desulfobulbus sp.]|jgi:DNA polymerase-3 subunit delta'